MDNLIEKLSAKSLLKVNDITFTRVLTQPAKFNSKSYRWQDYVFKTLEIDAFKNDDLIAYLKIEICESEKFFTIFSDVEKYEKYWNGKRDVNNDSYKRYTKTINFFVDKPYVRFSSVNKEFRRIGLGTCMYILGMNYLNDVFNMPLYSSVNRSHDSTYLWDSFVKLEIATKLDNRYVSNTNIEYSDLTFKNSKKVNFF